MEKLFMPIKDLIDSLYGVLYDAAEKVWNLAKPVVFIGLLYDLVSGKLGWINSILEYYRQTLSYTSGSHWLVLCFVGLIALSFFAKK